MDSTLFGADAPYLPGRGRNVVAGVVEHYETSLSHRPCEG
jgi:hypothetical protein